jgi:Holliday junction resolvase RusA-like endonuclease
VLRITAYGVPAPQGSTKAFYIAKLGRAVVTADNKRTKPWRQSIVEAARADLGPEWVPLDVPCALSVVFYMPRPSSAPKRVIEPAKLPDLDKLLRATCDALTAAGVWADDARLIEVSARKAFAGGYRDPLGTAGVPRAEIEVRDSVIAAALSPARRAPSPAAWGELFEQAGKPA